MLKIGQYQNLKVNPQFFIKPDHLNHPIVSGNKLRKLKYNLIEAEKANKTVILTFGGAYSNHISAVASAGKLLGFKTIGVIRGEELVSKVDGNPTLRYAQQCGMTLCFVTREQYRCKTNNDFILELKKQYGDFYLIPEGGTNMLAIKGCEEILTSTDKDYDYICCSVGSGGTISGIINSAFPHQKILGFPALKGDFLKEEISKFAKHSNWELITDYHFGGYGKLNSTLITFINEFKRANDIQLDPIYTGKMIFGISDLLKKDYFPKHSKILAIHTGGLQGIAGINQRLEQQGKPLIV